MKPSPVSAFPFSQAAEINAQGPLADILCFPIIDWSFRFQRPQQLMLRFARAGHRVFYLSHQFRRDGHPYVLHPHEARLSEVSLRGPRFAPHDGLLDNVHTETLAGSLAALRHDCATQAAVAVVQSPYWWPVVKRLQAEFQWPVVYDCMDHHAGFSNSNPLLIEQEREMFRCADLVVVSSSLLELTARRYSSKVLLVRNGCDYEHFAKVPHGTRGLWPVIGYYGAISDWFDSDLVADLAQQRPDWQFILVGSTLCADLSRLSTLSNVTLAGEKPYSEIPDWVAKFDVAILPFKRTPLTEAANPVKAYEIFAAGKPLVSVPLPEMTPLAPMARLASTAEEFRGEIEAALKETALAAGRQRREFALANTWQHRFETLAPTFQRLLRENRHAADPAQPVITPARLFV